MITPAPAGDDDLIAEFMQQFEAATDKAALVRDFAARHPHLAAAVADYAAGRSLINHAASPSGPAPHCLRPGEMLGDFRVLRFVAHGGMGEIYEAEQIRLSKRRVALKVIRQGHVSAEARDRFLREQAVLARLHQSNIVPVFAAGERDRLQYFAMQYIDGATLGNVVTFLRTHGRSGPAGQTPSLAKLAESAAGPSLDPTAPTAAPSTPAAPEPSGPPTTPVLTDEYLRSVAGALADVADALDAAHAAHFLHRDVKPSNLMVEKSGKCWVIDFGLAGLVGESAPADGPDLPGDPTLTGTGSTLGTPAYMAPEQFEGRADRRTDVWALGVTLYELLALRRPFPGPTHDDFRRQIRETDPAELRAVPPDLSAICRQALRRDPAERYRTAGEFAADLRRWLRHEPTAANPPWVWRRMAMWAKRQPGWASMVGVAMAAGLAIVGLLLELQRQKIRAARVEADKIEADLKLVTAAAEQDRIKERQSRMIVLQGEYLAPHVAGWRDRLWKLGTSGSSDDQGADLRDRMASLLAGLDARPVLGFNEGSASALAFDASGNRLLMGGHRDAQLVQPTRVRDLTTGTVKRSAEPGVGPIGWRGTVPVQLVVTAREPLKLVAWDVDRNAPLEEFEFPAPHRPPSEATRIALQVAARLFGGLASKSSSLVALEMSSDATHAAAIMRAPSGGLTILAWRAGTRAPLAILPLPAGRAEFSSVQLSLSPDGSLLAIGSDDGRVTVWTLNAKPVLVAEFDVSRSRVTSLTFARHRWLVEPTRLHPKGVPGWLLGAGDSGGQVVVWDLGRLQEVTRTRDARHEVYGLAFGPDAVTLYATGRLECRCWDVRSGRQVLQIQSEHRNVIVGVAVSPTNNRLAHCTDPVFGPDGGVDLFDLEWGRGILDLRGLTGQVSRVAVTPDGKRVAALTQDWQLGVWDGESGELLMGVEAPRALYADHDDMRLTDDGRFLVLAGGKEAHRWEVPARPNQPPRKADSWNLNPAWSNRLAVTLDGRVLLCRNETRSGKVYPNTAHPKDDPRCVRIYELTPGNPAKEIARHDEHVWHVFSVMAVPDGSTFIADGLKTRAMNSREIVAYSGRTNEVLWKIEFPNAQAEGFAGIDSTGTVLTYWDRVGPPMHRVLPYRGQPDTPAGSNELPILGRQVVLKQIGDRPNGLHLAKAGAVSPFLTLSPDERIPSSMARFTPDGRSLVWGSEDGTVRVGHLTRIREMLVDAGFPGW